MQFAFITQRNTGHGWWPELPEGTLFCLLAGARDVHWALYSYEPRQTWIAPDPVDASLDALIRSGMRCPPALAIARHDIDRMFKDRPPSQEEFARAYGGAIQRRLSEQATASCVLARATRSDEVDLVEGEWYWILRVMGAGSHANAVWVTDDYIVQECSATCFDLTEEQMERLRRNLPA